MKKIIGIVAVLAALVLIFILWIVFGGKVHASADKYFYIHTGATFEEVKKDLNDQGIVNTGTLFNKVAKQINYKNNIKPGRYEIKNGMNIYSLLKMLKAGNQSPVKFVINKLRTKEDFAAKIADNFETDSATVMAFMNNNDSLNRYKLDTNTVMSAIIPNTYELNWNSSFKKIFSKLKSEQEKFWNETRTKKAAAKNMTPLQVYTMASIIEEETNKADDKPLIASVYTNRIAKGQKLEADPTVKFALKNFALKRILYVHLKYESPYNTYIHTGLPPGPICTPSSKTIDAVLDAPQTTYMFFAAKPDLKGYHNFATTYEEHQIFAKQYHDALDNLAKSKK